MNHRFQYLIISILLMALTASCGNIKYLECQSDEKKPRKRVFTQHWVSKNTIKFSKQKYKVQEDLDNLYYELESTILQVPDRSLFKGLRKWAYHSNEKVSIRYLFDPTKQMYIADTIHRKQNGIRPWLRDKLGSPPVLLDTILVEKTRQSIERLLKQKAYFNAVVRSEIIKTKHKAFLTYHVTTGMPLLVDSLSFYSKDTAIHKLLQQHQKATLLQAKTPISAANLAAEKQRVTLAIRNQGYFDFNSRYIVASADTVNATKVAAQASNWLKTGEQGEPRANIYIEVLPYSDTSIIHTPYKISNVYITPSEYILKPHQKRIIKKDSFFIVERIVKYQKKFRLVTKESKLLEGDRVLKKITTKKNKIHYFVERTVPKIKKITLRNRRDILPTDKWVHTILRKKYTKEKDFFIRDKVLSDAILVEAGALYNVDITTQSVKKINNLAVFRFPRIEYVPSSNGKKGYLDCVVKMQPSKKQNIGLDAEFNNNYSSVASLGIAGNVSYKNKNLFKGAEIFELSAQLGIDFKVNPADNSTNQDDNSLARWINLLNFNTQASFYFPKFIGLNVLKNMLKMNNARTKIAVGYRYLQQASDFQISSFYGKLGYNWNKGKQHQFSWNPLLVNFTLEPTLAANFEKLLRENNIVLLNSLKAKYLIPSMDFTYTYSSNPQSVSNGTWFFKAYAEMSGNLLNIIDLIVEPNQPLRIFEVDYAQYFLIDLDWRYSYKITKKHSIVSRLMFGLVLPYGNSADRVVPFIKRFTLGGPSSMRAWNLRYLGPANQVAIKGAEFQMGDLRMEFNTEYRFMLNSWIGGALFADVGNIWVLQSKVQSEGFPYANAPTGVFTSHFHEQLAVGIGVGLRIDLSFFVFRFDFALQLRDPQGYGLSKDGTIQYWNMEPFKISQRNNFIIAIGYPF